MPSTTKHDYWWYDFNDGRSLVLCPDCYHCLFLLKDFSTKCYNCGREGMVHDDA